MQPDRVLSIEERAKAIEGKKEAKVNWKSHAAGHSRAWYGDEELRLTFPEGWEVAMVGPKDASALSEGDIENAFGQPIGTPRIAEMARGKRSAAIVVDDLSRPT